MPTRHGYMIKEPAEILDRAIDFSERLEGSATISVGDVVAVEAGSALVSLEPDDIEDGDDVTTDLISDDPEPAVPEGTKTVQFRLQGGEAGKRYKIAVTAEGDDGQVAAYDLYVDVKGGLPASAGS